MQNKLTKVFQKAKYKEDSGLARNVWQKIVLREKRNTLLKLWTFVLMGVASFIGLMPALKVLSSNLTQSGFYEYFSLIFSDSGSIISYWKEFAFSLVESLPLTSIILTLSLIFFFFLSIRYIMKQINNKYIGKTYGIA